MRLGFDYYQQTIPDILLFLELCKKQKISIYKLTKQNELEYSFYVPILQRYKMKQFSFPIQKSIGLLWYLLLLCKTRLSVIGIASFLLTVYFLSQTILSISITGPNPTTNQRLEQVLKEHDVQFGNKIPTYQSLTKIYDELKVSLLKEIDYFNIYCSGSVVHVDYTSTKSATKQKDSFESLYANKDGIIQRIEVMEGNCIVKENMYVKKGDLLVSNTITSTSDETKIIPVKGAVYAYTYQQLEASIDAKKLDEGEAFSYLLLKIRSSINGIDKIDRETVLKYDIIKGVRTLKIQYVFIENIAHKGDVYEKTD